MAITKAKNNTKRNTQKNKRNITYKSSQTRENDNNNKSKQKQNKKTLET